VTTCREFWAWWAHFGQWGLGRVPRSPRFFCVVIQRTFRQLCNGRFHQILSQNVVRCPVVESGKTFLKIFTLGVICPQNLKLKIGQTGTSLRAGYRSWDVLQRNTVVVQGPESFRGQSTFLLNVWLRSYGASKLPNFRILPYFPYTKPLKRTFRWPVYSPGVLLQNLWFFHVVVEGPKGCLPGLEISCEFC